MTFDEILDQAIELLQRRGRVSYRALKAQFHLDDDLLEVLKAELVEVHQLAVDENNSVLVWLRGNAPAPPTPTLTAAEPATAVTTAPQREPLSYTPPHLAEKILTSRSALEGERKQVTVLFCDLANSTALAEKIGPEHMHTLLNRFFELALQEVHRYEGTINQFLGDGFMSLFGAPISHEDHARRGVLAALALQQTLNDADLGKPYGVECAFRMGLNSGMVVVGSIGDNLRMDYSAIGDTTNVASRLQSAAAPGQIIMSEATYRLVAGYCAARSLGELSLKGKVAPMTAWELLGVRATRTRLEIEAERGLTPLVGRERELRLLHECFAQAQTEHGQIVFIAGEAGLGKSRLLLEFCRQIGSDVTWLEGRALSFGRSMAFHPLIDMLKRNFRLEEEDSDSAIMEKIEQEVLRLGEDLDPILPYLRYLFAVDAGDTAIHSMDPQLRHAETFDALRRLLLRAAELHPQVLVFEDLHWMDEATEAFLAFMTNSLPPRRILWILTYRPGYQHPFGDRTYHTRMALPALSETDTMQMVQAMLGTERLPEELKTLIVQKAEGNPFFIEQVIRSLQETGAMRQEGDRYLLTQATDDIVVPDTIQGVLMARIDRLPDAPKRTLQLGAVIGREFTPRLLDRLTDLPEHTGASLQQLKASELIYEKGFFPEVVYTFRHALTQDVAYNSLLVQQRQTLHRLAGIAIAELYADRLADHYAIIAHHFSMAEAWPQALDYLLKAADKAAKAFATHEALALYDQAEAVTEQLAEGASVETRIGIHQARAELYLLVSNFERARAESERVLALARQSGDQTTAGAALAEMGLASFWGHQFDQALADARQAVEIAEAVGAQSVLASGHLATGLVHEVTGQLDTARDELQQVITISQSVGDIVNESAALIFGAEIKGWEGRFSEAVDLYTQGMQIARVHNVLMPLLEGLFMCGIALTGKGDYDRALVMFEEGLGLAEKVGDENFTPRYLNSLGWLYIECGALNRAMACNQQAAEKAQERGDHESIANARLNLGDIFLLQGDLAQAQDMLDDVHRLVQDPATSEWMRWRYSLHLLASLGDFWLTRGDFDKAQAFADQCLAAAVRTNSRKYMVKSWRLKGEITHACRQWEESAGWLQQALTLARTVDNPTQLWKAQQAMGHLYRATHRPEMARQSYRAAREVIERVKMNLQNPDLHVSLERSPLIQQVYDLSAPG